MTARLVFAAALAAAVPLSGQSHVVYLDATAEGLFKASRNALGGEGAVSGIEALILRGTSKVSDGEGTPVDHEVEVRILLPDGILRIDTAAGYEKRSGVHGGNLLTSIRAGGDLERPPAAVRTPIIKAERARLGRLLLGMASTPIRPGWLTLRLIRSAVTTVDPRSTMTTDNPMGAGTSFTAERGGGRVLEGSAEEGFFIRLYFDGGSLPSRIQYDAGKTQVVTTFSDRRRVSGLLLPFHIVTSAGNRVIDDFVIREIIVNPRLTAADFER